MSYSQEKPNSLQIMEKFNTALSDIDNFNSELASVKEKMSTKLNIINTINSYTASIENVIKKSSSTEKTNRIIFGHNQDKIVGGNYDTYGEVVHAKYVQLPTHVFNILTETGPIFKDNAKVELYLSDDNTETWEKPDDAYQYRYSNMLKHESDKSKDDVFYSFEKNRITLCITMNSGNMTGGTKFDTIEICPYLPGSFDIECIRLYTVNQYLTKDMVTPALTLYGTTEESAEEILMQDVGNIRYQLDDTYELYQIEFDIILNYADGGGYPFGLRHLYFLKTAADVASDNIVLEVESDNYIEDIGEGIKLYKANGAITETTASEYGVKYYMFYSNDVLEQEITTNTAIARNIKTFYAVVPLTQPLIGIEFTEIEER